jgi:hypothetical protein
VQGTHREWITDAEAQQLPDEGFTIGVVDLVGDQQHRTTVATEDVGDTAVLLGDADGDVDDEQDRVGLGDGGLTLGRDLGVEGVAAGHPAAGVDEREFARLPFGHHFLAVTGDAGLLLDDGLAATDDPVEKCGLADVRSADDGDNRKTGRWIGRRTGGRGRAHDRSRARRNEIPSVPTISTVRGRSPGVMPSRNRPWERQTSGRR